MSIQNFKGDATELKIINSLSPLFDLTDTALNDFYLGGFDCAPFLLMLYDENRAPFSTRLPRAAFVAFIVEALRQFPFTGTFEAYNFVIRAVFGALTEISYSVPDPGKLTIDVAASASKEFEFIGREFVDGAYVFFNITDDDDDLLIFRGVPGIDTAYELNQLFAEVIPVGISPTVNLAFYTYYDWIDSDGDSMIDDSENQMVFREVGG